MTPALHAAPGDGLNGACRALGPPRSAHRIAKKKENSVFLGNIRVAGSTTSCLPATVPGVSPTASPGSKRQQRRVHQRRCSLGRRRDGASWSPQRAGSPTGACHQLSGFFVEEKPALPNCQRKARQGIATTRQRKHLQLLPYPTHKHAHCHVRTPTRKRFRLWLRHRGSQAGADPHDTPVSTVTAGRA